MPGFAFVVFATQRIAISVISSSHFLLYHFLSFLFQVNSFAFSIFLFLPSCILIATALASLPFDFKVPFSLFPSPLRLPRSCLILLFLFALLFFFLIRHSLLFYQCLSRLPFLFRDFHFPLPPFLFTYSASPTLSSFPSFFPFFLSPSHSPSFPLLSYPFLLFSIFSSHPIMIPVSPFYSPISTLLPS